METENYRGFDINIQQDECADDPREMFDHLGTMVCWHDRYTLGDKHAFGDNEDAEDWMKEQGIKIISFPLYLYDHSGITMATIPFSCGWDSGQVGYIFIELDKCKEAWPDATSEELIEKAKACLIAEVEEYDNYLTGSIYYYTIEPSEQNKKIECDDSCGGFYGVDFEVNGLLEYAKNGIDVNIKHYKEKVIKEKMMRVKHRNLMEVCF